MFSYLIKYPISIKYCLCILFLKTLICVFLSGNKNKGKGNGAGLAWECQSHCFADEFLITHSHSFGTDTSDSQRYPLNLRLRKMMTIFVYICLLSIYPKKIFFLSDLRIYAYSYLTLLLVTEHRCRFNGYHWELNI